MATNFVQIENESEIKQRLLIFLPIETFGEGEVNAHSRVQMALGEAKVKAKSEFEECLKSTGKSMPRNSGVHRRASGIEATVLSRATS